MAVVYRIRDWNKHFENNRTRELKHLDWVPVPNKHDGDGYTELMSQGATGITHLGAWLLILQVASKCDPRGTLLRDGARPHDCSSLARVTLSAEAAMTSALDVLCRIGWLEWQDDGGRWVTFNPAPSCGPSVASPCGDPAPSCIEGKGREGNGTEEKRTLSSAVENRRTVTYSGDFLSFWKAYPNPKAKGEAWEAWKKRKEPIPGLDAILTSLQKAKSCRQWTEDGGRFIPRPATWLNRRQWEDEDEERKSRSGLSLPPLKGVV